jgi:hypothetical protein
MNDTLKPIIIGMSLAVVGVLGILALPIVVMTIVCFIGLTVCSAGIFFLLSYVEKLGNRD